MTNKTTTTITHLFRQVAEQGDAPAIGYKENGSWHEINWRQYAEDVRQAAASLVHLGAGKGSTVCILGFNCYEWVVMDCAAMMIGAMPAGIYETCSPSEVAYILNHSEASVMLLENQHQWEKVNAERAYLKHLKHIVGMKKCEDLSSKGVHSWDTFMDLGTQEDRQQAESLYEQRQADDGGTLIYTSGTTGPSKAVMLSNENLAWTAKQAVKIVHLDKSDIGISYLPLSHIAEQMFTIHGPIRGGWKVNFVTDRLELLNNMKEIRPTIFAAVPRVWEKFHEGVSEKVQEASGLKKVIMNWAMKIGWKANQLRFSGKEAGGLGYRIANKLVFSKVKTGLGMDRLKVAFTAAAPISPDILRFFSKLDIPIYEIYGQSEGSGPTTFNFKGQTKLGSVGKAFPGTEVKLAGDNEILLKGPNVFLGYYKNKEATDACLKDGWLYSGDLGRFDQDEYLYITGRKKEIIVTSGGKNVAPVPIEEAIKGLPQVSQAVVIGDQRKFLSALITLSPAYLLREKMHVDPSDLKPNELAAAIEKHGRSVGAFAKDAELRKEIQAGIDRINENLARVKNIRRFVILPRDFSIDHDELTPTLKIKRTSIYRNWLETIDLMYLE